MRHWTVSWSVEHTVQAESKAEAEQKARSELLEVVQYSLDEILNQEPLDIVEVNEDGEAL